MKIKSIYNLEEFGKIMLALLRNYLGKQREVRRYLST